MKVLVFSDLQAHTFRKYSKYIKFRKRLCNSRLVNIAKAMRYLGDYAVEHGIDYILFSGDLFNERGKIPTEVFNFVHYEIKRWLNNGVKVIMVPGNHDCSLKHEGYSMETFTELGYDFKLLIKDSVRLNKKWDIVGVGHCEKLGERVIEYGKKKYKGKYKLLLSHFLVSGSTNAFGYMFENGMNLGEKELRAYDFCCIGDNHKPQMLGDHVLVPGSLVAHDFGDANQERGFWELDLRSTGKVRSKFLPVPAIKFWHKKIKRDIDLMVDTDTIDYGFDVIKFTIRSSKVGVEAIEKFSKEYPSVIIEYDMPKKITKRLDVSIDKDTSADCIESYVKKFKGKLSKSKLLSVGNEIWKEAGIHSE